MINISTESIWIRKHIRNEFKKDIDFYNYFLQTVWKWDVNPIDVYVLYANDIWLKSENGKYYSFTDWFKKNEEDIVGVTNEGM